MRESPGLEARPLVGATGTHGQEIIDTALSIIRSRPEWIHRRVDQVEFVTDRVLRVAVQLDLTVPDTDVAEPNTPRAMAIPIVTARKFVPFVKVDISADGNEPVFLLTTTQSQNLTRYLVLRAAQAVLGNQDAEDRWALADLVGELLEAAPDDAEPYARAVHAFIADRLGPVEGEATPEQELLTSLVDDLQRGFILFASTVTTPGGRLGIRFETDYPLPSRSFDPIVWRWFKAAPRRGPLSPRIWSWLGPRLKGPQPIRRGLRWLGRGHLVPRMNAHLAARPELPPRPDEELQPFQDRLRLRLPIIIPIPQGVAESYHIEVTVPEDLEVVRLGLLNPAGYSVDDDGTEVDRPQLHGRTAHRHTRVGSGTKASVAIQPVLSGWVARTAVLVMLNATLLWLGVVNMDVLAGQSNSVGLVVALAGLPAAFVANPFTHDLQVRVTRGRRLLAAASGLTMLVAALALVLAPGDNQNASQTAEDVWDVCAVIGTAIGVAWIYVVTTAVAGRHHIRQSHGR